MATSAPAILGYRMLHPIGAGGMGQVWLAEDEILGRRVAIKTISPARAGEGEARTRFLREARTMATVEHPHVVRVYAYGEARGQAYFVMERVEGESLSARLRRTGPLAVPEALRITREVTLALAAAWGRGIVHRDVKPGNILLDSEGRARVADFGLAHHGPAEGEASLTGAGEVVGSPHYMSPEQARSEPVDFRSDVYSLGVVLYQMLCGARPFVAASPAVVMARHLTAPLPPLGERRPDLPPAVLALVNEMTAKDRRDRPPSYGALLRRLDAIRLGVDVESSTVATSPLPRRSTSTRLPRSPILRRALLGTLAALGVAALGASPWILRHAAAPPQRWSVAVVALCGPDEASSREGRLLAALTEAELARRLGTDGRTVFVEHGRDVRSAPAARALGSRLGVRGVVWGEALSLGGMVEAQTWLSTPDGATRQLPVVSGRTDSGRGALEGRRPAATALARATLLAAAQISLPNEPVTAAFLEGRAGEPPAGPTIRDAAGPADGP
jgi:hypothetical protein